MKTKQEQIDEIADIKSVLIKTHKRCRTLQEDYMQDKYAEGIYKAGYRKASDVIDEFVERLLDRFAKTETIANCLHGRTNTEIDSIIKIVATEMRKEGV